MTRPTAPWNHVGPDTAGGRVLRRAWQPVYRACDLRPGQAVTLRALGEDFTLWRAAGGEARLSAHRCPHRGTAMYLGAVEGERLRCMHHGWCFDAAGACVERPGEASTAGASLRGYPLVERVGLLFAWLGEGQAPAPPSYPAWEAPGVLRVLPPEVWPCGFFQRLENSCDFAHLPYAHAGSGVGAIVQNLPVPEGRETDYGARVSAEGLPVVHLLMPNALVFPTPISEQIGWRDHLVFRVPVDDHRCVSFTIALIPAGAPGASGYRMDGPMDAPLAPSRAAKLGEAVLSGRTTLAALKGAPNLTEVEDYVALVGQGRPEERPAELLGRMDGPIALIRRIWRREAAASEAGEPGRTWEGWEALGYDG